MNKRSAILALALAALLCAGAWAARKTAFDWHSLRTQLGSISLLHVALGCLCIYAGFVLRAVRWAVLMGSPRSARAASPPTSLAASLIAPQFVGFTAVALLGRLADLTRPYLIARRTATPVAAQVAVYSIERIFDLAAAAILFSVTLACAPRDLPHHEAFARAGIVSLAATIMLGAIALGIRFSGERLASLAAKLLRPISESFANAASARILDFQSGLQTLHGTREVLSVLALSLLLWLGIAEAYVQSAHAFVATPSLASLTHTQAMLMMATSMGGSLVQLPVLGWFTQIAFLAAAIHAFFGAPVEAATACAAVALFCTVLSIVPAGLIAARLGGTSLRSAVPDTPTH